MSGNFYDVVIVGAGFAGVACAASAAARGARVMVIERKPWPGRGTHTSGILVRELAERWEPPSRLMRRIEGVRLYGPGGRNIDLHSPGNYFLATDSEALADWHRREAIDAGAALRFGSPFRSAVMADGIHIVNEGELRARYLVGADGARSTVASSLGMGVNRQFLFGVEALLPPVRKLDESVLHVFIDGELAPGYIGWIIPGVDMTRIGIGARLPCQLDLHTFMGRVTGLLGLELPRQAGIRSGVIPCGGIVRHWHLPGVMLLGDAAGMASPLTGGGIHPAVALGGRAGHAIADHLLLHGTEPHVALAPHLPAFGTTQLLRSVYDHLPAKDLLARLLFSTLPFRAMAQLIFFHQRGLFTTEAWRDLVEMVQEA